MAVLIEGISVVIKTDSIASKYPGGIESFKNGVPNRTLCMDSKIARVGFMAPDDVGTYISLLTENGLEFILNGKCVDIVVVDQQRGPTAKCDWIEFGRIDLKEGQQCSACRMINDGLQTLMTPEGWRFEGSLSDSYKFVETEDADKKTLYLDGNDGLERYLLSGSDKTHYLGRPFHREQE